MSEERNFYVELPRIKRNVNSWSGKVIDYLLKHPSKKPATDFSMEAITAFWLAEALEGQVSPGELQKACWSAIEQLEAKLATIRRIGGIEKFPTDYSLALGNTKAETTNNYNPTAKSNEQPQQVDFEVDEDDGIMDMELSEEMAQANKFFRMKS